jgi:hypothetical protein
MREVAIVTGYVLFLLAMLIVVYGSVLLRWG